MQGIQKLADKLEAAQTRIKTIREKGKAVTTRSLHAMSIVGGGAAAGALNAYMGKNGAPAKVGSSNVDLDMAAGSVMVMAGLADMAGSNSDTLVDLGSGMLAVAIARHTQAMVSDYAKK